MKKPILLTDLNRRIERIEKILVLLSDTLNNRAFSLGKETLDFFDLINELEIEIKNVSND